MSDEHECDIGDEVILGSPFPDGTALGIRHDADHNVSACVARPIRDGQPCMGADLVALERIEGNRYGVRTLYGGRKGPARVTTGSFREGWERTFGKHDRAN
jgi:hypothetical protein